MRIMQVNSLPIRQNRMAFRGEETQPSESTVKKHPLMQRLEDINAELNFSVQDGSQRDFQRAARDYEKVFDESVRSIPTTQEEIEILATSGRGLVQNSFAAVCMRDESILSEFVLRRPEKLREIIEVLGKSADVSNVIDRISEQLDFKFQNTIPELLGQLKIIFHLDRVL